MIARMASPARIACTLLLASCGRLAFDARSDGGEGGGGADVPGTSPDAGVRCGWSAGEPAMLAAPVQVESLTSGSGEADPFLVPGDPHTMYFVSLRTGNGDIYRAHRAALDTSWDQPTLVSELATVDLDSALVVDAGELHGYYDVLNGFAGTSKMFEVMRATTSDPFSVVRELTELDTHAVQYDPFPSADELTLLFTAATGPRTLQLYVAT